MIKVKIIVAGFAESLERQLNAWLADHRTSDTVNMQYQMNNGNHSVLITYRDGT